jgi:hypothetical protein
MMVWGKGELDSRVRRGTDGHQYQRIEGLWLLLRRFDAAGNVSDALIVVRKDTILAGSILGRKRL